MSKRSRSKQNRPRPLGNIVNRVFESSGPEGKVRGTPQQIIDKYLALARDAQLSGDRIASENFLQHAEHYVRLLNEALAEAAREAEARREHYVHHQQHHQQQAQSVNGQPSRRFDERELREGYTKPAEANGSQLRAEARQAPTDSAQAVGAAEVMEQRALQRGEPRPEQRSEQRAEQRADRELRLDWLGRRHRRFDPRQRGGVEARAETAPAADQAGTETQAPAQGTEAESRRPDATPAPGVETQTPASQDPAARGAEPKAPVQPPDRAFGEPDAREDKSTPAQPRPSQPVQLEIPEPSAAGRKDAVPAAMAEAPASTSEDLPAPAKPETPVTTEQASAGQRRRRNTRRRTATTAADRAGGEESNETEALPLRSSGAG